MTSTEVVNTSYKYIISPNYNEYENYDPSQDGGPGDGILGLTGALSQASGIIFSPAVAIGTIWYVANTTFGSAHIPNHADYAWRYTGTKPLTLTDVKAEYKVREKNNYNGSYTIVFSNGKKYHGKGTLERMFTSAILKMTMYQVKLKSFDWTPSPTDREAFKAEYRRMQTDKVPRLYEEGYRNPINYNFRQSPGKKYTIQDGF